MGSKQRKKGILINYVTLLSSSIINIFMTPYILGKLGVNDYGLYQTVNALASNLLIADLGTGTLMARFLSVYIANDDERGKENFVSLGFILSTFSALIIGIIGFVLYQNIGEIYNSTLSINSIKVAQTMMLLLIINLVISIYEKALIGIINAYEKFSVSKGLMLLKVILKALLIVFMLSFGKGVMALVFIELIITLLLTILSLLYVFRVLKVRAIYQGVDKKLLISSSTFMVAILFQTIVGQVNNSVDKVLLGAMVDTVAVSVYSVGMVIVVSYNMIANAIGSVYLPHITKKIFSGASGAEVTDLVIRPGRFNFMICGLITIVFGLHGQHFLHLWVGNQYGDSYYVALILMASYLIPHMESVMGSVLDAKNKRLYRSIIIFVVAIINIILTLVLIPGYGVIGATIATAIAIILGHWLFINAYYNKLGIEVKRLFKEVSKGTILSFFIVIILSLPLLLIKESGLIVFIIKCSWSVLVFISMQLIFGFDSQEKILIKNLLKRIS